MPRLAMHQTTSALLALDFRKLFRDTRALGARASWIAISWTDGSSAWAAYDLAARRLELTYSSSGGRQRTHAIALAPTTPRFGGVRWWARCPGCAGRLAVLYLAAQGPRCRGCLGLVYESTREDAFTRACRRRDKVRARIGGHVMERIPYRPRGRWRRTWERDVAAYLSAERAAVGEMQTLLDRIEERIGSWR